MSHLKKALLRFTLLLILTLVNGSLVHAGTLEKVTSSEQILLVYDSLDPETPGQQSLSVIQSILTSLKVSVVTKSIDFYQAGELASYSGIIEVINQPDFPIENQDFLHDRDTFQKKRLHIGNQLPLSWQAGFKTELKEVYDLSSTLNSKTYRGSEMISQPKRTQLLVDPQGKRYGQLNYDNQSTVYPYASLNEEIAYLPFWQPSGLSYLIGSQLLVDWLGLLQLQGTNPLLVFTGLTPFSDFSLLESLSQKLQENGLPYSISATGLAENLDQKAANTYLAVLNKQATQSASLFLQTPFVQGNSRSQGKLHHYVSTNLTFFIENKVYPLGISAPAFWNQDPYYQREALSHSDTALLLPYENSNPLLTASMNQLYQQAYVGIPILSFAEIDWQTVQDKQFFVPTALTVAFPETEEQLATILKGITDSNPLFANALHSDHRLVTNSHTLLIKNQQIFLDGQRKWIETRIPYIENEVISAEPSLNRFFATQNKILTVFIAATLVLLTVFLISSHILYQRKYGR